MQEHEVHILDFPEKEKGKELKWAIEVGRIGTKNNDSSRENSINHKLLKMFLLGQVATLSRKSGVLSGIRVLPKCQENVKKSDESLVMSGKYREFSMMC